MVSNRLKPRLLRFGEHVSGGEPHVGCACESSGLTAADVAAPPTCPRVSVKRPRFTGDLSPILASSNVTNWSETLFSRAVEQTVSISDSECSTAPNLSIILLSNVISLLLINSTTMICFVAGLPRSNSSRIDGAVCLLIRRSASIAACLTSVSGSSTYANIHSIAMGFRRSREPVLLFYALRRSRHQGA